MNSPKKSTFSPHRARLASDLFHAFDADDSGVLDLAEFTTLCRAFAPEMDEQVRIR